MRETHGVIFDLDGVIADTEKIHARIESDMLAEYGIKLSPEEISLRFGGASFEDEFRKLFEETGKELPDVRAEAKRKRALFASRVDEFEAIPGTLAVIEMLHGKKPLAVASASELATIDLILGKLSLRDRFDAIASTEEVSRGKPAPDVFLLAAKRLGVAPEHCIVIEDAISGMTGAKAAGMRVIALWNHEPRELPADLVAKDLRDVPSEWFE